MITRDSGESEEHYRLFVIDMRFMVGKYFQRCILFLPFATRNRVDLSHYLRPMTELHFDRTFFINFRDFSNPVFKSFLGLFPFSIVHKNCNFFFCFVFGSRYIWIFNSLLSTRSLRLSSGFPRQTPTYTFISATY